LELARGVKFFEKELYPYYFLYILSGFNGFDIKLFLDSIDAPKHYYNALKNQRFIQKEVNDETLKEIAIDIPISKWLGNYKKGIKQRAKELGIWDKKYNGGVRVEDVIKDGYKNSDIAKELKKRKILAIKEGRV